jgi:hypothetical protein
MQDKQKVTLYLRPELHRQLKIQAAVDSQPMSEIAERAIGFYLDHPDVIDEVEASVQGSTHQVYALVFRSGDVVSLMDQPGILSDEELPRQSVVGSEELVAASV